MGARSKGTPTVTTTELVSLLLVVSVAALCANADYWEYKLVNELLKDYDPSIRPSIRHNSTLNVTFGLALAQIIDVPQNWARKEVPIRSLRASLQGFTGWIDNKLQWNPDDYDGIQFIHIPHERIWRPDILLVNNADSWAKISSISTNAIVKFNGNVTWLSTVIFKSSCSINVRFFPFDEQQCDMIFASWTFDGYFLDIDVNSNEGDVTNYIKNGEWHLVKLLASKILKKYSCCDEPYPEIYYRLVMRRRPLFYVFNMVFPCMLITLVAFLGFYLPPGSTEKVSIGITTLLSITVFLMLVAESMPPTSEQLPLLGIYYAVTIGIVSFSTTMAVITLNINNKGSNGRRVPRFIRLVFFNLLGRILCTELSTSRKKYALRNRELLGHHLRSSQTAQLRSLTNLIYERKNGIIQEAKTSVGGEDDGKAKSHYHHHHHRRHHKSSSTAARDLYFGPSPILKHNRRTNASDEKMNENESYESLVLEECLTNPPTPNQYDMYYINPNRLIRQHNEKIVLRPSELMDSRAHNRAHSAEVKSKDAKQRSKQLRDQQRRLNAEFVHKLDSVVEQQFGPLIAKIMDTLNKNEVRTAQQQVQENIENEWADVARVADHFFCYFFPIMTLLVCGYIFFKSPYVLSNW